MKHDAITYSPLRFDNTGTTLALLVTVCGVTPILASALRVTGHGMPELHAQRGLREGDGTSVQTKQWHCHCGCCLWLAVFGRLTLTVFPCVSGEWRGGRTQIPASLFLGVTECAVSAVRRAQLPQSSLLELLSSSCSRVPEVPAPDDDAFHCRRLGHRVREIRHLEKLLAINSAGPA